MGSCGFPPEFVSDSVSRSSRPSFDMGAVHDESSFHVLAVDDSLIDRKLIERLLRTSSYRVTTVDSGSKALEFLGFREDDDEQAVVAADDSEAPTISPTSHREVEVNLIITDYCMPGMTGYDLLKKIKESSTLRNIPVVIMSSENVPSRITECLEEGAEEFFLKPVRLSDLHRLRPLMKSRANGSDCNKDGEENDDPLPRESRELSHHQQNHQPTQHQLQLQQQQSSDNSLNSNKRKASDTEEGFSPDRTRPRYSGCAAHLR